MTQINYLDLFSGCGGFRYGLKMAGVALGYESHSDIDKHANSTYARHYKESEAIGDIKSIKPVRGKLNGHKINLITFGFPCQDLSVAGKGEGFSGDRSSLFYEATRLIRELRPEIFIFENVKGLFSNKEGRTFTDVLREIADIGLYECEWQLLNTRWFLPQNRERIYFIGHHGGQARRQVFPIGEEIEGSVEGAKQTAVNCLTAGGNSGRLHSSMSLILNKGRGFNKGGISKECGAITSSSFEQNNFVIPSTLMVVFVLCQMGFAQLFQQEQEGMEAVNLV
jgi:DNA (cytosine-5)-methyltransferase 1